MSVSIRKIENNSEADRILTEKFTSPTRTGYVEVGKAKVVLPIYFQKYEERIRKFEVRDDDVFLFGFPKSGTTWCHEMIWMIVNNLDFERAKEAAVSRCPMLEISSLYDFEIVKVEEIGNDPLGKTEQMSSPRCIKSHLHWSLIPEQIRNGTKQPKLIFIFREPKDSCVSHFHMARLAGGFKGTFEEFAEMYLGERVLYGPYWEHVRSFWKQRHRPNVLIVKYTEMKADISVIIRKVAQFLDKDLREEQVEELVQYLSFQSMKRNEAVNQSKIFKKMGEDYGLTTAEGDLIRSGKLGDYLSLMSPELVERFDKWTKKNIPKDGFTF